MSRSIEFHFDFRSPYSYLAHTQLPALAQRTSAQVSYHPFRILELMQMVGNRPTTIECKNKGAYANGDLARWANRYGVPMQRNQHMREIDGAQLGRGVLVAGDRGQAPAYVEAVFAAMWRDPVNLAQRDRFVACLEAAEIDGASLLDEADEPETIARLDQATEAAAARGVFGSPTFFVGETMFFGNDRLDWVEHSLVAAAA
jgi:2-hydroxychromene-2-carboxylate isomerase